MIENPQAFPYVSRSIADIDHITKGMTLRDYFAGQALTGVNVGSVVIEGVDGIILSANDYAIKCYAIADAMLKERAK